LSNLLRHQRITPAICCHPILSRGARENLCVTTQRLLSACLIPFSAVQRQVVESRPGRSGFTPGLASRSPLIRVKKMAVKSRIFVVNLIAHELKISL